MLNEMESTKLSKTVRKRLKKKTKLQHNAEVKTNLLPETPPLSSQQPQYTQKGVITATQPSTIDKPTPATKSKKSRRGIPENRVVYINSNYGGSDPNSIGGRVQAEMIELRKQSKNIKSASDLTESQAHVIKRQITRLQGAAKEKVFKRPKKTQSIDDAAKELKLLMESQQKSAKNKKSTNTVT